MHIKEEVPLAPLTTFGIGGKARFFARAESVAELKDALAFARANGLRVFFLGGGSNILFDKESFDGLIIKIDFPGVEEKENLFIAGAGESWDALVERAVLKGLWGIENLSGIPGSVGGAVVQNIGAYGAALSQTLKWVEVYDTSRAEVVTLDASACRLGYRDSIFKHEGAHYVILKAALELSKNPAPNLSYKDLAGRFIVKRPTLHEIRETILEVRGGKFPDISQEGTAGSFFKNPILSEEKARTLAARYPGLPLFAMPEAEGVKIPLAWLLDHVLSLRGFKIGRARLFERQPLVIVAEKGSSSADVKKLAAIVQEKIFEVCEIKIEPEVTIV